MSCSNARSRHLLLSGSAWWRKPHKRGPKRNIIIMTPIMNKAKAATAGYKIMKAIFFIFSV